MPTEMECVIKGTIVQKRRWRQEYITGAISGVARVTERVMLYRSLMTSTVWAPALDELCVCLCAFSV